MFVDELKKLFLAVLLLAAMKYTMDKGSQPQITEPPETSDKKVKKHKVFIPTQEWQLVEEGQPVPGGLHIKMDFESGKKWAKLLDDDKTRTNSLVAQINDQHPNIMTSPNL